MGYRVFGRTAHLAARAAKMRSKNEMVAVSQFT